MATRRTLYLKVKRLASGLYGYYWEPSPALVRAGWDAVNFGTAPRDDDPDKFAAADARNEEVAAWKAGGASPRAVKAIIRRHTFADLATLYRAHINARVAQKALPPAKRDPLAGKPMSPNTRANYFSKLDIILIWGTSPAAGRRDPRAGDIAVASITTANVLMLRDALMRPDPKTGEVHWAGAHGTLRVLRSMLSFAEKEKIIPKGSNPAMDFELPDPPSRSTQWDEDGGTDDFDTFLRAAKFLGFPSIALAAEIAAWTSQRQADILKLTAAHWKTIRLNDQALLDALRGDADELKGFVLVQNKTGRPIGIPIVEPLRAAIEATIAANLARDPPQLTILLSEETGRPWRREYFARTVKQIRDFCAAPTPDAIRAGILPRPGLKDLWFMDLRRTRVCWLADRGLDAQQIGSITGHSAKTVEKILETTYRPRTTRGAAVAILAAHGPTARKANDQQEKKG